MGAAVSITRLDLTALELRKAASGEKNSAAARRILALALVLDGVDRRTAAETCGMDRQTLRDWVHRYNAAGLAGLRNLKSPGPGSKLTARQQAELAELVEAGPDPAVHGVVRWRRIDLRDELQRRFGVNGTSSNKTQSASRQSPPEHGQQSITRAVGIKTPNVPGLPNGIGRRNPAAGNGIFGCMRIFRWVHRSPRPTEVAG
jgi:transposase